MTDRTITSFNISVGTGLALESLFTPTSERIDESREVDKVEINKYDGLWLNLSTLFRNYYNSILDKSELPSAQEAKENIQEEINIIEDLCKASGLTTTVYWRDYHTAEVLNTYRLGIFKNTVTGKQLEYNSLYLKTVNLFRKEETVNFTKTNLKGKTDRILILTHYPLDLLDYKNFSLMDLLESHTGKIKSFPVWHTKYCNGNSLPMIPFNKMFLPVFGDDVLFRPRPLKERRAIVKIATDHQWSFLTTSEKIRANLASIPDRPLADALLHNTPIK